MGAKSGAEHHFAVRLREDKLRVIELVGSGMELKRAVAAVGRQQQVLRNWLEDADFVKQLDAAKSAGERFLTLSNNDEKFGLSFSEFSKEFLNTTVFPHNQNMIDILEGRDPQFLHEAMVFERGSDKRLLVNVPPEHAKTTTLTVNYPTFKICMNPNIRIVVASQTATRAKEFLYSIKQRLTEEPWLKMQQVYAPVEGWEATSDQWREDRIYLKRDSGEKDPTVQALGVGQQIYGARADLIILDDIVGTTNAHEWQKQLAWLQKMVITRLGKNGVLIIAGTRVSPIDLYRELMNPDHWSGGRSPFTRLAMPAVLEFADKPKDWVTLWPKSDRPWDGDEDELPDEDGWFPKWDGPALHTRRSEVSPSTWALVYQQQDIDDDAIFSAAAVMGSVNRMRKCGPINPKAPGHPKDGEWITMIGLDPAMVGKTAAIVYAVDRHSGRRMILDAYNMSEPSPQKIDGLIKAWVERYRPVELRIEINAFQKAFALDTDLRQWLASYGCVLREHFTGKNKWDVSFGVAAMSQLFGTVKESKHDGDNLLSLPDHENNEHVKALIQQLITWKPDTKDATDLVMALWFCEIRAREIVQQGAFQQTHINNRWVSRRGAATRGVMDLNNTSFDGVW